MSDMEELKEKIAIAVRRAQSDLDGDMFGYQRIMFDVAAGAALRAIEEAGYAIVPASVLNSLPDNPPMSGVAKRSLEEPRG